MNSGAAASRIGRLEEERRALVTKSLACAHYVCTLCSFPLVAISRFVLVTSRKDTVTYPRASLVPLDEPEGWWRSTTRTTFPSRGSRTIMHISPLRLTAHVCVCDVLPFSLPRRTKRQTIRGSYDRRLYSHPRPARLHVCTLCILQPGGRPTPTRASACPCFWRGKGDQQA